MDEISESERFLRAQIGIQQNLSRQAAAIEASMEINDLTTGWFVLRHIIIRRRNLRRYLRSRFGVDVRLWSTELSQAMATWYDFECFFKAAFGYCVWNTVLRKVERVVSYRLEAGDPFDVAAWSGYQAITDTMQQIQPGFALQLLRHGTADKTQTAIHLSGVAALSGWSAAHLSRRNHRLTDALSASDANAATELLRQLPAAVELASGGWMQAQQASEKQPPASILARIAHEIEQNRWQWSAEVAAPDGMELIASENAELEQFSAREEARAQLQALIEEAGLSTRERQVWQLAALEGYKQKEIADILGIQIGTVGKLKERADAKIQRQLPHAH